MKFRQLSATRAILWKKTNETFGQPNMLEYSVNGKAL